MVEYYLKEASILKHELDTEAKLWQEPILKLIGFQYDYNFPNGKNFVNLKDDLKVTRNTIYWKKVKITKIGHFFTLEIGLDDVAVKRKNKWFFGYSYHKKLTKDELFKAVSQLALLGIFVNFKIIENAPDYF